MTNKITISYKIVAKSDHLAVHSVGYYGDLGKQKAQSMCDEGYCARHWSDKKQASIGFEVIPDKQIDEQEET